MFLTSQIINGQTTHTQLFLKNHTFNIPLKLKKKTLKLNSISDLRLYFFFNSFQSAFIYLIFITHAKHVTKSDNHRTLEFVKISHT